MQLITNYNIDAYSKKLTYHGIWFGTLYDHLILCIASLFSTQQNPSVILWTDKKSYPNLMKIQKIFMNYDFQIKLGDDIIEDCQSYQAVTFRSDKWRFEILHKFGGIYFDLDILFLRDISWFANYGKPIVQEGFPEKGVFNSAIAYYPANHNDLRLLLSRVGRDSLGWTKLFEIQKVSSEYEADLIGNSLTDRGWTGLGPGCDSFFSDKGLAPDCFGDSFVYHWHNRWNKSVHEPGTLVNHYWKKFVEENDDIIFQRNLQ